MGNMTDLIAKLKTDDALQAVFAKLAAENGISKDSAAADLTDAQLNIFAEAAKNAGVDISIDDIKAYFNQSEEGEMSDDELSLVAGGVCCCSSYTS